MSDVRPGFRLATAADADRVAALHADSWRRHYRGALADSFLDGDVAAERRAVWSERLAAPAGSATILAEHDGRLVGFIHVIFDHDKVWGSFVDNLHVVADLHGGGVGTRLLGHAARAVGEHATGNALYLWVLRQNVAAQRFYEARGGTCVETAPTPPPGGDPARLAGTPDAWRMTWPAVASLNRF